MSEPVTWYHGTGRPGGFQPGEVIDQAGAQREHDQLGAGIPKIYLTQSRELASHHGRNNAIGRYDYFGQGDAHPRVYEMEPLEGLEHVDTGATVQRARVVREVPFRMHNGKGLEVDHGDYPWGGGEAKYQPHVLEPDRHTAARPGRGEKQCPCCQGKGEHGDGSECHPCDGQGIVHSNEPDEYCPGQPRPRRRHWREAVLGSDVPRRSDHWDKASPDAPAYGDHPADYGWGGHHFTLRHIPIDQAYPPGERYKIPAGEESYVARLAEHPESLPPLTRKPGGEHGTFFGGNHRLEAWHRAGWTHVPAWVPDVGGQEHTAALDGADGNGYLYHSGAEHLGGEDWVHLGTEEAARNRARDWIAERAKRGEPEIPVHLHTVELRGSHYPSTRTDNEANDPTWRDIADRGGHDVLPYTNEFEDPGTTSYLARPSAVHVVKTERIAVRAPAHTAGMDHIVLYHGTSRENAGEIARSGLRAPDGLYTPGWPVTTVNRQTSDAYATRGSEHATVEIHVPKDRAKEYLWPAQDHMGGAAYGLRKPLPAEFVHAVHPVTERPEYPSETFGSENDESGWRTHEAAMADDETPPVVAHFEVAAMAWNNEHGDKGHYTPVSVRDAGFAGLVGDSEDEREFRHEMGEPEPGHRDPWEHFDESLHDNTAPEPTDEERREHEEDGESESYTERHDQAYEKAFHERERKIREEDTPDHEDPGLRRFREQYGSDTDLWKRHGAFGGVSLRQPIYATQSHVAKEHIEKYTGNRDAEGHAYTLSPDRERIMQSMGREYLGDKHPLFVTHEGRVHVIEGHHRVATDMATGRHETVGWHFNLDKHPALAEENQGEYPEGYGEDEELAGHHRTAAAHDDYDAESAFGDYTLRHRTEDQGERKPRHIIEAFAPDGSIAGRLNWYGTSGVIHHIEVAREEDDGQQQSSPLGNGQNHQRRGLATAMWNWGREIHPKLRHSGDRTPQGAEWAKAVGGPGLRSHKGSAKTEVVAHFEVQGGPWYHASTDELEDGATVQTAAQLGRETRGGPGDEHKVWVSDDPVRAGAYGVHIYEVRPHSQPKHTRGPDDEHETTQATVVRKVPYEEARQLSKSYQAGIPVVAHFEPEPTAEHQLPYMKPPGPGAETAEHILQYHTGPGHPTNLSREDLGLYGDDKHWQRWHDAEHRGKIPEAETHQHLGPVGTPGEQHWPATHDPSEHYYWGNIVGERPAGWHPENYAGFHPLRPAEGVLLVAHFAGPDELPPDPGTRPIPEGHVRLWHYTPSSSVPSIRETGLERRFARGDGGTGPDEPSAGVWASTKRPDDLLNSHDSDKSVVEFHAHPSEISGQAESPWQAERKLEPGQAWEDRAYDPDKLRDWAKGYHHVIMRGDVPKDQILAIHEPWHAAARYMRDDKDGPASYQWVRDEYAAGGNDHLAPYVRGLNALERHPPKEAARQATAALENPYTHHAIWYHGTQADPADIREHGLHSSAEYSTGAYQQPESETDDSGHWNAMLGVHLTADHEIAGEFARGEHEGSDNEGYGEPDEEHHGVIHARVHLNNPKFYNSEHDLDHEAYEHEFAAGNHPQNHHPGLGRTGGNDDPFSDDYDEEQGDAEEMWPHAHRIARDYGREKIPASTYGHHMSPFEQHPMRTAWLNTHPDKYGIAMRHRQRLIDQGYDGVVYRNEYEKSNRGAAANTSIIAFHPDKQIEITQHHDVDEAHHTDQGGDEHLATLASLRPRSFSTLEKRLLGKGGDRVANPGEEPDLDRILDRGQDWEGSEATMRCMKRSDCHANASRLHESHGHGIATGYALSDDGIWRQHSWGIHKDTGKPIETTTPREKYHGVVFTDEEAGRFARANPSYTGSLVEHFAVASAADEHEEWERRVTPPYTGQPLMHGTRSILEPGEELTPEGAKAHPNNPDIHAEPYVHATTSGKEAEEWGERASSASADARMHELGRQRRVPEGYNQDHAYPARVYLVHGEGVEPDPHKEGAAYRAKKLRVIREVRPLSCYAEECGNAEHWPDHPHYEFLRQEQEDEDEDGGLESHFATADTWQETDEHGTYDDEHGLRHHPDKGWWCHGCQAHHDSPEEVEEHDTGHTDWDEIYPQISQQSLHRGISVHLPQHLHEAVHDQARPVAERARMLSDHLAGTNYGTSWSTNPDRADHYAYVSEAGPGATHVIMRAHMVPQSSIETDPDELADRRVIGYDKHEDQEVPLRRGAQVNVHTIEWRRAPDRDGSGREAFTSHAFPERQQHLAAGVTPLEAHFAVTDWGKSYDKIPGEIHRGLFAPESHQVFSTPASDEDIAHMLIRAHQEEHFPYDQDQHEKFGTHWTSSEDVARNFAHEHETEHAEDDQDPEHDHAAHFDAVPVVFHARRPEQHEIETDPRRLGWQNVDDHDEHEGEREVPIRHGAPVTITGVSWLKRTGLGPLWHRHDLREPVTLRAEDRDSPEDESEWNGPNPHTAAGGQYIPPPEGGQMWQHLQEAHGVNSSGKTPGDDFMGHLHDRFHAGQIADRRLVQHHHEGSGPTQADLISHFFTQAPVQKPVPVKHEPERLDDNEYTLGDVSRRYDWEGFDKHEIEHLVAKPEHATFTREDVPVHSLRAWHPDGRLRKPITYKGIARQGKDERDRLDEVERGMNEGAVPPIVVVRDGKHHIIADGSHRSAIARERGHSHIEAFVTDRTIPHGHTAAAKPEPTSFLHEYEGYGTAAEGGGFVSRSEVVHGPFYHGGRAKNLGPGDMITPGRKPNPWGDTFDHKGRSIHTYFAHEPETAVSYARETKGHLYEVKPTGKVEFDGSGGNGSWRSEHPLEVVRRIPEREWDELPMGGRTERQEHTGMVVATAVADKTLPVPAERSDVAAFWGTESDPDPRGIAEGLPGFFQAAAASLDALAARFADSPAELLVPYITRMADSCRNAEQDAAEVAGRLPAAPEGVCKPPSGSAPKA